MPVIQFNHVFACTVGTNKQSHRTQTARRCFEALCLQGILVPIYVKDEQSNEKIAHLAKEHWELPVQIKELENWLFENPLNLMPSKYIADVGFSIRENACGGGAILSPEAMTIMGKLGIKLYLSEYGE